MNELIGLKNELTGEYIYIMSRSRCIFFGVVFILAGIGLVTLGINLMSAAFRLP